MRRYAVLLCHGLPSLEEQPPRIPWDFVECRHQEPSSYEVVSPQVKEGTPPRQLRVDDTMFRF